MDALQKVFDTIMGVLEIIKNFFSQLFPQDDAEGGDATTDAPETEA